MNKQPQSYAEMFEMAFYELKKRTDEHFKQKEKEFDILLEAKLKNVCQHNKTYYSQYHGEHVCSDCGESMQT